MCRLACIIFHRTYNWLHRYDPIFVFTQTYWRQRTLIKKLHQFTDKVIVTRREKLLKNPDLLSAYDEELGKKKKMALLDILLQSQHDGKPLSNTDIREEIDTFMFEVNESFTFNNTQKCSE